MTAEEPLATEDAFFEALVKADAGLLGSILADFLTAVSAQDVTFHRVDPADRQVRRYGATAVVTGRTQMSGASGAAEFTVASRYAHVFVRTGTGGWKLVSAQGTPIAG